MSDSKWEKVDAIVRSQQRGGATPELESPLSPLTPIESQIDNIREQKMSLIGNFKKNRIDRNAALVKLKAMHDSQIESVQHALRRAVDVEKERIDVVANKYIFQITEEYLNDMRELGLKNYETRMQTYLQLNTTATRLLEQAEGQDVPPAMKKATLENILRKYNEFAERIMEEETRLPNK